LAKVVLAGFMGSGKTSVGSKLAELLDVPFFDSDAIIEKRFGKIPEIFKNRGEQFFRKVEEEVIAEILNRKTDFVLSIGGGAIVSNKTQNRIFENSIPIYLSIDIRTAFERVRNSERPLAKDFASFKKLFYERKSIYDSLPFFVDVQWKTISEIAFEIKSFLEPVMFENPHRISVSVMPVSEVKKLLPGFYITDQHVFNLYKKLFENKKGVSISSGEHSKTMQTVVNIYDKLLSLGISRGDFISYVGGGVVGDVAGFVASTLLRGVPFTALPSTLLSMTDSAIGGKNGVNLPYGKNLAGTFYFPEETFVNPMFLRTLPLEEVRNGSGEIFKYALLSENGLFELLENANQNLFKSISVKEIIAQSVSEKLSFVQKDPFDRKGVRAFLNLGHTVGHAIEKLAKFDVKHGEAVAFGIVVSAFFSKKKKLLSEGDFERIFNLYKKMGFKFPEEVFSYREIYNAILFDKKRSGGKVLWIIPVKYNRCISMNVSVEEIAKTYREVANENSCN